MQDLVGAGLDANAHFAAATAWVSAGVRNEMPMRKARQGEEVDGKILEEGMVRAPACPNDASGVAEAR